MSELINKLDDTYLDGSPRRYGDFSQKYDTSATYLGSPEGTIRGQGNLLDKFNQTNFDLSFLSSGIYFIDFINETEIIKFKMLKK